jgi:hypothetical protein
MFPDPQTSGGILQQCQLGHCLKTGKGPKCPEVWPGGNRKGKTTDLSTVWETVLSLHHQEDGLKFHTHPVAKHDGNRGKNLHCYS